MDNRASKAEAVSKPKGRHVEVRKDRGTARKAGEIINSIARLIRAVAVLVETLRGWFFWNYRIGDPSGIAAGWVLTIVAPGPPVSTAAVGNSSGRASAGRRRGLGPAPLDLDADALDEGALPRHLHRARVVPVTDEGDSPVRSHAVEDGQDG